MPLWFPLTYGIPTGSFFDLLSLIFLLFSLMFPPLFPIHYCFLKSLKIPLQGSRVSMLIHIYPLTPQSEYWSDHMQTPSWQSTLYVAWCLIWLFYGHTWHRMSLLRPQNQTKPSKSVPGNPQAKPQQKWREVQFTTSMKHHQEKESEGRQAEEGGKGPRHHRLAQRPQQHRRDVWSEEADKCPRKLLWVELYILSNKCIRNCVSLLLLHVVLFVWCLQPQ